MSITDELRKFAWKECPSKFLERVVDIADRIDEKHESVCCEIADKFDGWVIPPKDADGEIIHIGDRLRHENGEFTANDLTISVDGLWRAWDGENGYTVLLRNSTHVKPDSWERIICDALSVDRDGRYAMSGSRRDELVERCKRLAGEDA